MALLEAAGFEALSVPEGHVCCGSAGTYNLLQPELAEALRERKVAAIESLAPDAVVAGNFGCITQIAAGTEIPVCISSSFWIGRAADRSLRSFRAEARAGPLPVPPPFLRERGP